MPLAYGQLGSNDNRSLAMPVFNDFQKVQAILVIHGLQAKVIQYQQVLALYPGQFFQIALKSCASSIILGHNHPSGNLKPSESDMRLTKKLKNAGVSLDLPVLDHIILTSDEYYSFADEGIL